MAKKLSINLLVCLIIGLSATVAVRSASVPSEISENLDDVPVVDADPESVAVPATVVIVNDIRKFLRENPNIIAEPLNRVQNRTNIAQQRGQIRYTLGKRVSGDRLVAVNSDSISWSTAQNVELTITYPASGLGSIVSYVDITVSQSSNLGQGYVISGGIGLRWITVVIEAYNTYNFSYTSYIYGQ